MTSAMRSLGALLLVAACTTTDPYAVRSYPFGPYTVQPSEEIADQCVQITLHNDTTLYINTVELTTGAGFHHSNWVFVPESGYTGDDGTFRCADRQFDQALAVVRGGGVLFAQSTQSAHDVQSFPPGAAIEIPAHYKLLSTIHLLNPTDNVLQLHPVIALTPIDPKALTTKLAGMSFENHAIGLPAMMQSRFTVDCDLTDQWNQLYTTGQVSAQHPDFHLYYALAHYHTLGTGLTIEAVKPDGTAATIFTTANKVGDSLGSPLDPPFSMAGYTRLRFSCDYYNNTGGTVVWGTGSNEMCVFLSFTDSAFDWGGGIPLDGSPGQGAMVGSVMTFNTPGCMVFARSTDI